jgi:hypothetical protein
MRREIDILTISFRSTRALLQRIGQGIPSTASWTGYTIRWRDDLCVETCGADTNHPPLASSCWFSLLIIWLISVASRILPTCACAIAARVGSTLSSSGCVWRSDAAIFENSGAKAKFFRYERKL